MSALAPERSLVTRFVLASLTARLARFTTLGEQNEEIEVEQGKRKTGGRS